jgi:hypothetical protein
MKSILTFIILFSMRDVYACEITEAVSVARESVNDIVKSYGASSFKFSGLIGPMDNLVGPFSFTDQYGYERLGLVTINNCQFEATSIFGSVEYSVH